MSVTSDEVNFLIYRYLQESGFTHSSFTFAYESLVTKSSVTASDLPPGALIALLQKGLQYVEIEAHLNEDGTKRDVPDPFALLMPYAVRKRARMEKHAGDTDSSSSSSSSTASKKAIVVKRDEVTMLKGHSSEVFICSWNPKFDLLASGSKDSTARIWGIPHGASGMASGEIASLHPQVLNHGEDNGSSSGGSGGSGSDETTKSENGHKDVTTLDWDPSGKFLATGTFDGQARIWNQQGELVSTLKLHTGPIFSLKWNKSGSALLSGSVDKTAIIWDPLTGNLKQQFKFHTDPTLDVDWRDDDTFATCSTDKSIHVCQLGANKPIKTFSGHVDEVNAIKWSPCGKMLASCSDDHTTKIWSLDAPGNGLLHDFTDHDKEVCFVHYFLKYFFFSYIHLIIFLLILFCILFLNYFRCIQFDGAQLDQDQPIQIKS
jgi:transducin (beta)-like 1